MLVNVVFNKSDKKSYIYNVDEEVAKVIKPNDWVVVMASKYNVVLVKDIVMEPTEEQLNMATKYIIDIVDTRAHKLRVKEGTDECNHETIK